jgi:hypothetical protein
MATVSVPSGTIAPVKIRAAVPEMCGSGEGWPAVTRADTGKKPPAAS